MNTQRWSLVVWAGALLVCASSAGAQDTLPARGFASGPGRIVPVAKVSPNLCVRFEPVEGSYLNDQVDLTSLTLSSPGTGSVTSIRCIPPKSALEADQDRNGIAELPAWFAGSDVALLFDHINRRTVVSTTLMGSLLDGTVFSAEVPLTVIRSGRPIHDALVAPNPFNPRGTLRVTTSSAGTLRARVFDVQGRFVRTLIDRDGVDAGTHDLEVDGRDEAGRPLRSGVYFYAVETVDGTVRGRFTILQ